MSKQKRHTRISKKGKPFRVGKKILLAPLSRIGKKAARYNPPIESDLYDKYITCKKDFLDVVEVTPEEFLEQKNKVDTIYKPFLSDIEPDIISKNSQAFLTEAGQAGVLLSSDGEIMNLFSLKKGEGEKVMLKAIELGGYKLDCFDKRKNEEKGLPDYYKKFGFKEIKREKNWVEGEQDVVFMER